MGGQPGGFNSESAEFSKFTAGLRGQKTGLVLGSWPPFLAGHEEKFVELTNCHVQVGTWFPGPRVGS